MAGRNRNYAALGSWYAGNVINYRTGVVSKTCVSVYGIIIIWDFLTFLDLTDLCKTILLVRMDEIHNVAIAVDEHTSNENDRNGSTSIDNIVVKSFAYNFASFLYRRYRCLIALFTTARSLSDMNAVLVLAVTPTQEEVLQALSFISVSTHWNRNKADIWQTTYTNSSPWTWYFHSNVSEIDFRYPR